MAEQKLLGDYLEELLNGWCRHSTLHTAVQALKCPRCIGDALKEVQEQARAEVNAEWSNAWGNFSTVPSPEAANQLHAACMELAQAHDSTTRAEVLAACIAALEEKRAYHERWASIHQDKGEYNAVPFQEQQEYGYRTALKVLRELQPAATDLEELVQHERAVGWDMAIVIAQNKLVYMHAILPNEAQTARKQLMAAIGAVKALRKEKVRAIEGKG